MSLGSSSSQANKLGSNNGQDETPIDTYESARRVINKQTEALKEELSRTEIEWLNLCYLTQQSTTAVETKPTEPTFKAAAEINALPLPVKLELSHESNQPIWYDDEDRESSDDE